MAERKCRRCGSPLGIDDDLCQVCGERNPVRHPWYIWPLAAVIFLLAFYFLVDLEALRDYVTRPRVGPPGTGD